jgi:hypothetical protein
MAGLTLVWTAHAAVSDALCMSWNQLLLENVIVHNMSSIVKCACSITLLLLGFLTVVATGLIP